MEASQAQADEDARWKQYNYPPLIKLFHYSLTDLQQPMLSLARRMHAAAIVVLIIQPVQLLNCILQVTSGCSAIRKYYIVYALANMLIWPALAFFVFYNGYTAICQGPRHSMALILFYAASATATFFYAYFAISGGGA